MKNNCRDEITSIRLELLKRDVQILKAILKILENINSNLIKNTTENNKHKIS